MIVYLIRNRVNGKCYVGQTVQTLEQRWYLHAKAARGGSRLPIHCAIRKYGPTAFNVSLLSCANSKEELDALERRFIVQHDSRTPNGYNCTAGGRGFSGRHSEATKQRMRQSHLGSNITLAARKKSSAAITALWRTEEFRKKNKGRLGKKTSEITKRRQSEAIKRHWEKRRKKKSIVSS